MTDWPKTILQLENRQNIIKLPEAAFRAEFLQNLEKLMSHLANPDPLAKDGRTRALRPATLFQYRRQIIRFASELVHAGVPINKIVSIAALLVSKTAERGLRQMLSSTGNKTVKMISEVAALLHNLSRIAGQTEETRKKLTVTAARLASAPQRGMTGKNRNRLRNLQNDKSIQSLLHLPDRLFSHPPSGRANAFT